MPNTSDKTKIDSLRRKLARLTGSFDTHVPTAFTQAMQSFLTALDYQDVTLMRATLQTACESLVEVLEEAIEKRLEWAQESWEEYQKILALIENEPLEPDEQFDSLGRSMEDVLNQVLSTLRDIWEGPVATFSKHNIQLPSATRLEAEIQRWQAVKESVLGNWPWVNQALPAVDRKMVAKSREAFNRGEKESIEDLIRRVGGDATLK